jgi:protocatechuate 3,4-dioxygenase beta subunit
MEDYDSLDIMKKSLTTTTISKVLAITLSLTLLLTYATFVGLPQSSFAQVNQTQTNQSSATQQQPMMCATTEPTIQGPEYKQGPPFREGQNFAKGLQGPRLELSGRVLSMNCKPVEGAVLDI